MDRMDETVNSVPPCWVVMGVSGCGKSTVGRALAEAVGCRFVEGDDFHPAANVAKMAAGHALDDADRSAWLLALQQQLALARAGGVALVVSCSALKRRYRDVLRLGNPAVRFVHLEGARERIFARMAARAGPYMPPALLDSQLGDLEPLQPDEHGVALDLAALPALLVERILAS